MKRKSIVDHNAAEMDQRWEDAYQQRLSLGAVRSNKGTQVEYEKLVDKEEIEKSCRVISAIAMRVF